MSSPLGWGRVAAPICFSPETLLALNADFKPVPYMLIMQSVILAMPANPVGWLRQHLLARPRAEYSPASARIAA
jgi:hypothetical protein